MRKRSPDSTTPSEHSSWSQRRRHIPLRPLRRYHYRIAERRLGRTRATALFAFVNGALSIGLIALFAHLAAAPLIFPSLGPTAYLMFTQPQARVSSPRNTVLGHAIGALAGWGSLALFGLIGEPSALQDAVTWARVGAAALSLGASAGAMVLTRTQHPPAGATTLIVSLGLMTGTGQLVALMMAVALLVVQAWTINRLAGIPYPLWAASPVSESRKRKQS